MAATAATPAAAADQPKITLFWLNQSRSQRILWLLEELKLPYELTIFHRDPKTMFAGDELKSAHPLGKSPVMHITPPGAPSPVVLAESAVIIEYLLDHFAAGSERSTLLPRRWKEGQEGKIGGETEEWMRFRYFMHYAEGSLMTLMLVHLVAENIKSAPVPFFIKPITSRISGTISSGFTAPNFVTHFTFLEDQIKTSGGDYLCGKNLTGADIIMSFPLIAGRGRTGLVKDKYPSLYAYTERLEKEPGYERAVKKIVDIEGKYEVS